MLCEWPVGGCTMNEDWEQVTPFLHDMQHCAEEDYFNPQEVSETLKAPERFEKKKNFYYPSATVAHWHCRQPLSSTRSLKDIKT